MLNRGIKSMNEIRVPTKAYERLRIDYNSVTMFMNALGICNERAREFVA